MVFPRLITLNFSFVYSFINNQTLYKYFFLPCSDSKTSQKYLSFSEIVLHLYTVLGLSLHSQRVFIFLDFFLTSKTIFPCSFFLLPKYSSPFSLLIVFFVCTQDYVCFSSPTSFSFIWNSFIFI